jgi:hypothetical protein
MRRQSPLRPFIAASWAVCLLGAAHATEGGGTTYALGADGLPLAAGDPVPGLYLLALATQYQASRYKDNQGRSVTPPDFSYRTPGAALVGVWVTPFEWLGGRLIMGTALSQTQTRIRASGLSQSHTGLGDTGLGLSLVHRLTPRLNGAATLNLVLPTGDYQVDDPTNTGRNYRSVQPQYSLSYVDPQGLAGSLKLTLNLNQRNKATDYRSGRELAIDYSLGWNLGGGWTLGASGYLWWQIGNDDVAGMTIRDNRARALAIGPAVKYQNAQGWFITAQLLAETGARNTTQGTSVWVRTVLPF